MPGGGTDPNKTFIKAAEIMREIMNYYPKNIFMFYISDGYGTHPS
jgi:hypothetical protein